MSWYIFEVFRGKEDLAERWYTSNVRCEIYYPKYVKLIRPRWRRSKEPVEIITSAFPGYIFFRPYPQMNWIGVWQNPHVVGMLTIDGEPQLISDAEIDRVRRREARGDFMSPLCVDKLMTNALKGSTVTVPSGQFKGIHGAKVESVHKNEVTLSLPMLSSSVTLKVSLTELFPDILKKQP